MGLFKKPITLVIILGIAPHEHDIGLSTATIGTGTYRDPGIPPSSVL
jgi:hypothetical protein